MSARDSIIATLEEPNNRYINFTCGRARVYGAAYPTIARAIRNNHIHLIENDTILFEAMSYNHYSNRFFLNPNEDFTSMTVRSVVIHEATHAIADFHRQVLSKGESEGAGYIAQMMYCLVNHAEPIYEDRSFAFMSIQVVARNISNRILRTGNGRVTDRELRELTEVIQGLEIHGGHPYLEISQPVDYNGF